MRRRRLATAACLALAAGAGCGDDASSRDERAPGRVASRSTRDVNPRDDVERAAGDDESETTRLRRRIDELERRVQQLERGRAGDDLRPDAPTAGAARAATASKEALWEETERLRERVLGGVATPEDARRYWSLLGDRADGDADAPSDDDAATVSRELPRTIKEDVRLPLDETDARWKNVKPIAEGARGGAASFVDADARIDVGPCPVASTEPFTLHAFLRTRDAGFATALIAREGESVGFSLVMGRVPGHVSFEAWSWATVRLVSRHRVDDGAWHEIEVAYDPRTRGAILTIDDVRQDAAVLGSGGAPAALLRLGDNIGVSQPFRGDLDEVYVLRRTAHPEAFGAGAGDGRGR